MIENGTASNGSASADGSPGPEGHRLPGLMDWYDTLPEKAQRVVANVILERGALISALTDQRRNLDQDCGYPEGYVQPQTYQQLYDRESIAARVVEVYPLESWQVQPTVYEDEDPATETEFEKVWDALGKSLSAATGYYKAEMGSVVWEYLSRADVLSGVGQYGVILLGLDDGKDLSEPAEFVGPPPPWMQDSAPDATPQDDRPRGPGPTGGADVPPPGVLPAGTADTSTSMGRPSVGSPLGYPVRNVLGEGYTQALSILERGFQTNHEAGEGVGNAFCATGPGGGVDPSCSPGGGREGAPQDLQKVKKALRKSDRLMAEAQQLGFEAAGKYRQAASTIPAVHSDLHAAIQAARMHSLTEGYAEAQKYATKALNLVVRAGITSGPTFSLINTALGVIYKAKVATQEAHRLRRVAYKVRRKATEGNTTANAWRPVGNATPRKPARRLLFLRVFPETMATIASYDVNPTSPRFGQPTEYVLTFLTPTAQGSGGMATLTTPVHWTRCIHVADNLGSSEVFGTPRQQQVLNRLLDLRKLYGGSAEMYWRGAFPGYSIETLPQLGTNVEIDEKGLRDQMYRWANGLQRYVQFTGMSMKGLSPQVVDPTGQINTQLEAICIKIGVPKRIFMGSERGELASSQDEDDWNDKLGQRQNLYVTPRIIVPFVDRLIALGVLPPPAEGYLVEWPGLSGKSESQQATIGGQRTTALVAYAHEPAAPALMAPMDFFTRIMGFSEDEAQTIVDNAEEEKKRIQAEEDAKAKQQAKVQADALAKAQAQQAKQAPQGPSGPDGGRASGPGPSGGTDQPPGDGPGPGGKPPRGGKPSSDPAANARGDQPRVPPGSPEGGEFTSVAGSGGYVAGDKVKVLRSKITGHEGLEGLVLKVQTNGSLLVKLKNGYRDLFRPHEVQPTGKKGNVEPDLGTNPLVGSDKPVGGGSPTKFTLAQLREASLQAGKQLFDHPEKNERLYYTDVHSIRYRHLDDLRAAGEGLGDFEYIFKPSTGKGVLMQAAASDRWDKINPKQAADKDGKIYSYTAEGIVFVTETAPKKGRGGQSGPPASNAFCATGPGGGIDPSCSPNAGGSGAKGEGHDPATHEARALEGERLSKRWDETNARLDHFAHHEGTLQEVERAHEEDPHLSALWDRVHGKDDNPFGPDITPPKDIAAGRKYLQEDHTLASAAVAATKAHLAKARGAAAGLEQEAAARLHAAADAAGARLDKRLEVVVKHHARSLDDYDRWASLPAGHPQQEQAWSNFDHSSKQVGRALDHLNSEAGLHGFFDRASSLFDRRRRVLERDAVRAERELQRWDHQAGGVYNAFCATGSGGGVNPSCSPRGGAGAAGERGSYLDRPMSATGRGKTFREFYQGVHPDASPERPDAPAFHDPLRRRVDDRLLNLAGPGGGRLFYRTGTGAFTVVVSRTHYAMVSSDPDGRNLHVESSDTSVRGPHPRESFFVPLHAGMSDHELNYRLSRALGVKVPREDRQLYDAADRAARAQGRERLTREKADRVAAREARRAERAGPAANVFCSTGPGGGIDPSCSPSRGGGGAGAEVSRPSVDDVRDRIERVRSAGATSKNMAKLVTSLSTLTVRQLTELKKSLGLRAGGRKSELARKVAEQATARLTVREHHVREARKEGYSVADLRAAARDVRQQTGAYVDSVRAMLKDTRATYAGLNPGKALTRAHRAFKGGDHSDIAGFDVLARTMAGRHPELLGAHGYEHSGGGYDVHAHEAEQRLYDFLYAGPPKRPPPAEVYGHALDALRNAGPGPRSRGRRTTDEEVPF